jgi:hypothetical protein
MALKKLADNARKISGQFGYDAAGNGKQKPQGKGDMKEAAN